MSGDWCSEPPGVGAGGLSKSARDAELLVNCLDCHWHGERFKSLLCRQICFRLLCCYLVCCQICPGAMLMACIPPVPLTRAPPETSLPFGALSGGEL